MPSQTVHGYRRKPRWIYAVAAVYLLLPFAALLQFLIQLDYSWLFLKEILSSEFFLAEVFCSWTAALAIFVVSRISFYYFIALSLYTIGLKIYNFQSRSLFEYPFDFLVVSFWFLACVLLLFTTLRIPYLNPKTRWWTQPVRYGHFTKGALLYQGLRFPIVTLDFSKGGVFLKLDERAFGTNDGRRGVLQYAPTSDFIEQRKRDSVGDLMVSQEEIEQVKDRLDCYPAKIGEMVQVKVHVVPEANKIFPGGFFEFQASVAWAAKKEEGESPMANFASGGRGEAGTPLLPNRYRYGLGLQFTGQTREEKERVKQYLRLIAKGSVQSRGEG